MKIINRISFFVPEPPIERAHTNYGFALCMLKIMRCDEIWYIAGVKHGKAILRPTGELIAEARLLGNEAAQFLHEAGEDYLTFGRAKESVN